MSATKGMLSPLIVGVDARVIGGDGASDLCDWMIESGAGTAPLMPKLIKNQIMFTHVEHPSLLTFASRCLQRTAV